MERHLGSTVARCTRTDLDEHTVLIELYSERPERKGSGVNRGTIHMRFDLRRLECRWHREDHGHGDRVRTRGVMRLIPDGEGACAMVDEGEIEIRVPLLGRKLARKFAAAVERNQPVKARWWEDRLSP